MYTWSYFSKQVITKNFGKIIYRLLFLIFYILTISCSTNNNDSLVEIEDSDELFSYSHFIPLNLSSDSITIQSLMSDIYNRDSLKFIDDFNMYLNPQLYIDTHLDTFPINTKADTIYFRNRYIYSEGYFGSYIADFWNSNNNMHILLCSQPFKSESTLHLRSWEKELIEEWNTDSIKSLTRPTFHEYFNSSYPAYYIYQIIIHNGDVKTRTMFYTNLYIPNELENNHEWNSVYE